MTKQRADGDAPSSNWLRKQLAALPPSNKKPKLAARAFWLKDEIINDPQCMAWLEMCAAVDRRGELLPLLELLKAQGVDQRSDLQTLLLELLMRKAGEQCGALPPLFEFLKSHDVIPKGALPFVEDLFDRLKNRLQGKQGRPRTPLYDLSESEAMMALAVMHVRALVNGRMGHPAMRAKDAMAIMAEGYEIAENKLENAYHERRGSRRKMIQRLKRA